MSDRVDDTTCPFCGSNRLFTAPNDTIVCPPCIAGILPDRDVGRVWVKPCHVCKRDPAFAAIHNGCSKCEKRPLSGSES